MKFAQAREIITPNISTTMSGYASRTEEFKGIHDDFYVKTLYFENNDTKMMIITFDLCHYLYDLNIEIMNYASKIFSISVNNIIVNYSHTHAGPKITSATERDSLSPLHEFFIERAKTCIDRAKLNVFEGSMQVGRTSGRWNINRRLKTSDGFVMKPNHNAVTDDEVNIIVLRDTDNVIRTVITNYSCHPVTLSGTLFLSSEFPGRLCQLLESEYYGSMAFFLQGSAGNMRPLITADKGNFKACSFQELDEFAHSIKNEVIRTIHSEQFDIIEPEFNAIKFNIDIPINPLEKSFYEEKANELTGYIARRMQNIVDNWDDIDDIATIHCGIIKITDDLYIPFMGGEIVYEVKEIVRDVFKSADVIFLGYHEALTYIPSDKIIEEGGYEGFHAPVFSGFRGPFKEGIDEIIKNAFTDNLLNL